MANYSPKVFKRGNEIIISGVENFDLRQTFDCGQAFRWSELNETTWQGIALGRYIKIGKENGNIIIFDADEKEYEEKWRGYLDIDRNYAEIIDIISENEVLKAAAMSNGGIRVLRQDPWEALCSFIISQNNNIPRIKGIIERLCELCGEKTDMGYLFPSAEKIADMQPDDLAPIRSGFRARYIIDGAQKYISGGIDLEVIRNADIDTARAELKKITGVGDKVADCTLLFGFSRIDALPKDVWIKRAIAEYFDGHFPDSAAKYAGIAQQYLFNYIRNL